MNSWTELFNFFIFGGSLFLSVMGLWFTVVIPGIDRWSRRFFMNYFIIFLLSCLSCIIEMTVRYFVPDGVFFFLLILETFLISLPLPMMTLYLLHICQEDTRSSKLIRIVLGMWGTFFVMLTGSLLSNGLFMSRRIISITAVLYIRFCRCQSLQFCFSIWQARCVAGHVCHERPSSASSSPRRRCSLYWS